MIYGNYAKQYGYNNRYKVVSESDSIIEYMTNEIKQYKDIMVNESYIDDNKKLIMEAKIEALQEAVTGAIIAAIIALVTALIALIAKFISMLKQGASSLNNKDTNNTINTTQNNSTQKSDNNIDNDKKEDMYRQIEAMNYYNKLYDDIKNKLKNDFEKGQIRDNGIAAYPLRILLDNDMEKSEFKSTKDKGEVTLSGVSDFNFSDIVDDSIFRKATDIVKNMRDLINRSSSYDEVEIEIDDWIKELKKLMENIIKYEGISTSFNFNSESMNNFIDYMKNNLNFIYCTEYYKIEGVEVYNCVYNFKKNKINEITTKRQERMQDDLKELKSQLEKLDKVSLPPVKYNIHSSDDNIYRDSLIKSLKELQNMIKFSQSFMGCWANIENYRLRGIKFIKESFYKNYEKAAKIIAWEKTRKIYNNDFKENHPYPSYDKE